MSGKWYSAPPEANTPPLQQVYQVEKFQVKPTLQLKLFHFLFFYTFILSGGTNVCIMWMFFINFPQIRSEQIRKKNLAKRNDCGNKSIVSSQYLTQLSRMNMINDPSVIVLSTMVICIEM